MPEAEWRDAWKRYFKISRLTRQIVVVPSWESYTPAADDVTIALDPGMAFGTGTHASTQLVLEELQALADGGLYPARVLDMGCGSGILAIAAAKLWPKTSVIAIDNDPIAITATADNAAGNGVGARITAALPGAAAGETFSARAREHPGARPARAQGRADRADVRRSGGVLVLIGPVAAAVVCAVLFAAEFVAAGLAQIRRPHLARMGKRSCSARLTGA